MTGTLEVCIDTAAGIAACEQGGADRIELCSALALGGLTPSKGMMELAARSSVPSAVMIRPRAGDFCFSEAEIALMCADIDAVRDAGLGAVVLGAGLANSELDLAALEVLCDRAALMNKTLHRVIDLALETPETLRAIDQAVEFGFDRILTSGGAAVAPRALARLRAMRLHAGDRIEIMAGSGVTAKNAEQLMTATGITTLHASCGVEVLLAARFAASGVTEDRTRQTNAAQIRALKQVIASHIAN
jgi:copper homeostasis protein